MNLNAFTLQLTQYLIENHPDKIADTGFIQERGQRAVETFAACSRQGMNVEESLSEAHQVLYQGLHFSPYRMVYDLVESNYGYLPFNSEARHNFCMKMMQLAAPVFAEHITRGREDEFEGSPAFLRARIQVKNIINQYLKENGLQ